MTEYSLEFENNFDDRKAEPNDNVDSAIESDNYGGFFCDDPFIRKAAMEMEAQRAQYETNKYVQYNDAFIGGILSQRNAFFSENVGADHLSEGFESDNNKKQPDVDHLEEIEQRIEIASEKENFSTDGQEGEAVMETEVETDIDDEPLLEEAIENAAESEDEIVTEADIETNAAADIKGEIDSEAAKVFDTEMEFEETKPIEFETDPLFEEVSDIFETESLIDDTDLKLTDADNDLDKTKLFDSVFDGSVDEKQNEAAENEEGIQKSSLFEEINDLLKVSSFSEWDVSSTDDNVETDDEQIHLQSLNSDSVSSKLSVDYLFQEVSEEVADGVMQSNDVNCETPASIIAPVLPEAVKSTKKIRRFKRLVPMSQRIISDDEQHLLCDDKRKVFDALFEEDPEEDDFGINIKGWEEKW